MNPKLSDILDRESWELKSLSEIATDIYNGSEITKEQLRTGEYPAIKCGDINSQLPIQFNECISFVDENLIKNPKYFEHGDLLISNLSNKLETVATSVTYLGKEKCLAGLGVTVIKHNQNSRYLAHVLRTKFCRTQIEQLTLKGTVFNFWNQKIKQIKVPLPPLEIQNQIADYLDKFTEMNSQLEAELEAELEERKIQYKYYRDELIIGRDEEEMKKRWQIKTLNEIANDIYSGSEITKEQLETGNYPSIKCGDINSKLSMQFTKCVSFVNENLIKNPKYFEYGDILISGLAHNLETIGSVCVYLGKEKCLVGNDTKVIKHNQNPKYLAYVLNTEYCRNQIKNKSKKGSTVIHLYSNEIKDILIPLPSLKEQEEIVSKLDKFNNLIGTLESGIPWLIQANRDQYKHYKNQIIKI